MSWLHEGGPFVPKLLHSWVAVAVGVGSAAVGAYGASQSAKAANKSKNAWTDSTTTQDPYMAGQMQGDINAVLGYQRGIAQRGAPQIDGKGNVYYSTLPTGEAPPAPFDPTKAGPAPPTGFPGGGSGAGGKGTTKTIQSPSTAASGKKIGGQSTWTNAKGQQMTIGANGKPVKASPSRPTTSGGPAAPAPKSAADIFRDVAARGMEAGNSATVQQGRTATQNILGAAGGGGPEQTGFEGYNPILDRLAGTLEGDVGDRRGRELLMSFLNENNRGGGAGGGGSKPGGGTGSIVRYGYAKNSPQAMMAAQQSYNSVPDSVKADSYFADETRKIMDEQANEAELKGLIDAMNADTEKAMFRDMAQLDAAAAGSGRFGGDMWKGMSSDAREEALQEMLKTSSGVRMSDREARRQARLAALAGVNQRDQALLGANVQREGINASSAAAAGAAADQIALAKRGQDLQAIGALMDSENYSLGQLGDVGAQLSGDRLTTMGMIPGLEGVGLQGLQLALGGGGGLVDLQNSANNMKIAQGQMGIARAGLNQQRGMFNAGQYQDSVDSYMRTLLGIGGMGGTSRTYGQNVVPGAGISTTGAAIQGGIGAGLAAYGAYKGY